MPVEAPKHNNQITNKSQIKISKNQTDSNIKKMKFQNGF
jgi:hypothetical protein